MLLGSSDEDGIKIFYKTVIPAVKYTPEKIPTRGRRRTT